MGGSRVGGEGTGQGLTKAGDANQQVKGPQRKSDDESGAPGPQWGFRAPPAMSSVRATTCAHRRQHLRGGRRAMAVPLSTQLGRSQE